MSDRGFYPSCVVNLTLRFDEALQVARSNADLARAIRTGEIGRLSVDDRDAAAQEVYVGSKRRALPSRKNDPRWFARLPFGYTMDGNGQVTTDPAVRDRLIANGARDALRPLTFGGDGFTTVMNTVPLRGTFDLPHPRQAATFTMSFAYDDLPIDPRLLRAAGVEIHLGCVAAQDYGDGMVGTDEQGGRRSRLATRSRLIDPNTGRPAPDDSTLLFYGTVDKWEVEHAKQGGSTALLTGRSIVGILLDGKPPADILTKVDLTQPIHRVVAALISTIPIDVRLTLDVYTDESEWDGGVVPSPGSIDGFTRVRLTAAEGKPTAGAGGGGDRISYWDLITNLCNFVGAIPYLQGNMIWVRPGRSIFDVMERPGRTPFREERYAPDGQLGIRRLVLGRDVRRFKLDRKLGGTPVPIVIAYGRDDRQQGANRIITGQWPPADSVAAKAKADDVTRVDFPNIRDKDRLIQIARDLYEQIGRGEIGGEFESARLASFGGDNSDPDLLRLRPLEPVECVVDASEGPTPIVHELTMRATSDFDQEVADLVVRIGDVDAARAIVAARRGAVVGILDTYRVTSVRFEVDATGGVQVSGTFQNYIVSRHGQSEEIARGNSKVVGVRATAPGAGRKGKVRKPERRKPETPSWFQRMQEEAKRRASDPREIVREQQRREDAIRKAQERDKKIYDVPNSVGGRNGQRI